MIKFILWIKILQKLGLKTFLKLIYNRLFTTRISNYELLKKLFQNKNGIEIGGPSNFFTVDGEMPIYNIVSCIDTVNPSVQTIWEGDIKEGLNFLFDDKKNEHSNCLVQNCCTNWSDSFRLRI